MYNHIASSILCTAASSEILLPQTATTLPKCPEDAFAYSEPKIKTQKYLNIATSAIAEKQK